MVAHTPLKTPTAVADFLISRFDRLIENIESLRRRLQQCAEKQILIKRHRIEMLRQRLAACSPERIFNMGYSLTMANGHVVRSIADIRHGQTITTHLKDGTVSSIAQ
jgi:exodeoxyribonuclease VII large subunit